MKAIVFAALCVVFVSCELVDMGTWVADTNNKFAGMSMEELRQYVGTYVTNFSDGEVQPTNPNVPKTFDPTTDAKWGQTCVHPIRNQGQCGSCWAFGLSESFSDRVCVATFSGTVENVVLSPENLVSCDTENYGCSGGYLNLAWQYATTTGIVTDSCFPYDAEGGVAAACQTTCNDGSTWTPYKASNPQALSLAQGQQEMFTNGPIETAFMVYDDFFSYKSGVYKQTSQAFAGGHAIKVIGWGIDKTAGPYWIAYNSWGTDWGMNGVFWIGQGQCEFDSNFIVGQYQPSSKMTPVQTFEKWIEKILSKVF